VPDPTPPAGPSRPATEESAERRPGAPTTPAPVVRRPGYVAYAPEECPRVRVRPTTHPIWLPGRLHAWLRSAQGWRGVVTFRTHAGLEYYLDLPAEQIRQVNMGSPDELSEGALDGSDGIDPPLPIWP